MVPLEIYLRDIAWRVKVVDSEGNCIQRKLGEKISHSDSQQRANGANDPASRKKIKAIRVGVAPRARRVPISTLRRTTERAIML